MLPADAVERLWRRDHTLWQPDPTEVANRLGWLDCPAKMPERLGEVDDFVDEVRADGFTDALVLGMGGSSLFPEVVARSFPVGGRALRLRVLDTTDPAAIRRVTDELEPERTVVIAASKSGTTIETRSHLAWFWSVWGSDAAFVAITDPGSELEAAATDKKFRHLFTNDPNIGGRYSALSLFGLVAAALAGVDIRALLAGAASMADACRLSDAEPNPGLALAHELAQGVADGRDKLTLLIAEELAAFGLWVEQLVAESTGKSGTGLVPVVGEPPGAPEVYGDDRLFVRAGDAGAAGLGGEVFRWEVATALVGAALGINPFDQPDVAAAKEATARVLDGDSVDAASSPLEELLAQVRPRDYVSIQAYVDPGDEALVAQLEEARVVLRDRLRVATTFGLGPRFLHSTGQLHKGGPPTGVFVQVVGDDAVDVPIPGRPFGFSQLKWAQADGDLGILRSRGLRAARVSIDDLLEVR